MARDEPEWTVQTCEVHPGVQMHSGICPKCGDSAVHTGTHTIKVAPAEEDD